MPSNKGIVFQSKSPLHWLWQVWLFISLFSAENQVHLVRMSDCHTFAFAFVKKKKKHESLPLVVSRCTLSKTFPKEDFCDEREAIHNFLRLCPKYEKTLPEAQRTQGIDSLTWAISPAENNATCIGSIGIGQLYVVPLVQNLTTRWRH